MSTEQMVMTSTPTVLFKIPAVAMPQLKLIFEQSYQKKQTMKKKKVMKKYE